MSLMDLLPIDAPTDEGGSRRRMPGQGRVTTTKPVVDYAFALHPKHPAPPGAPRKLADIPAEFRDPAKMIKPPVRR